LLHRHYTTAPAPQIHHTDASKPSFILPFTCETLHKLFASPPQIPKPHLLLHSPGPHQPNSALPQTPLTKLPPSLLLHHILAPLQTFTAIQPLFLNSYLAPIQQTPLPVPIKLTANPCLNIDNCPLSAIKINTPAFHFQYTKLLPTPSNKLQTSAFSRPHNCHRTPVTAETP